VPAIALCKKRNAARVIVAAPVSGEKYIARLEQFADEIVILEKPEYFYAVGQVYTDFHQVTDHEVRDVLQQHEKTVYHF